MRQEEDKEGESQRQDDCNSDIPSSDQKPDDENANDCNIEETIEELRQEIDLEEKRREKA